VIKMVRRETAGVDPAMEERAKQLYFANMDTLDVVSKKSQPLSNHGLSNTTAAKKRIKLNEKADTSGTLADHASKKDNTYRSLSADKVYYKSHEVPQVEGGHYLIANVFKDRDNADSFVAELRANGVEANYFTNPANGMNYVYVGEFQNKGDAFQAHRTRLGGTYSGEVWVMNVNGGAVDPGTTARTQGLAVSKYGNNLLQKNVAQTGAKNNSGLNYGSPSGEGPASGYYIIAEVFQNSSSARKYVKELNAQGLHASYFVNPEDNLRYVYLKKHETWGNALTSYYTQLKASTDAAMWILRIKPNQTV